MNISAADRQSIVRRARHLADSSQFKTWEAIAKIIVSGNERWRDRNPFEDYDLRRELDARCAAARGKNRLQMFSANEIPITKRRR